jgi:hypothetical protein
MENLQDLTSLILRPGTFAISVAVVILTFFAKRIVELALPQWKATTVLTDTPSPDPKELLKAHTYKSRPAMWWNEVILYAIPVTFGALIGLMRSEFLHGPANAELGARIMWSAGVGWFSSFFYTILRRVLLQKTGVDIKPGGASIAPVIPSVVEDNVSTPGDS